MTPSTVQFINSQVEDRGLELRTVANRHDIDVADVYRALTYYHDHPEEMRAVEREREAAVEAHEALTTDPDDVRSWWRIGSSQTRTQSQRNCSLLPRREC